MILDTNYSQDLREKQFNFKKKIWKKRIFCGFALFLIISCVLISFNKHQNNVIQNASKAATISATGMVCIPPMLKTRGWATFGLTFGMTFFSMIAYSVSYVKLETCNELALASILGEVFEPATACIGVYVVGAISSAIAVGLVAHGGQSGLEWWKDSKIARGDIHFVSMSLPLTNASLYEGRLHAYDLITKLDKTLGPYFDNVVHAAVLSASPELQKSLVITDNDNQYYTWTINHESYNITVFSEKSAVTKAASSYVDFVSGIPSLQAYDEGQWLTFNTYGVNVGAAEFWELNYHETAQEVTVSLSQSVETKIQDCCQIECHEVANKFCAAIGQNNQPGVNSMIVGEVYIRSYGDADHDIEVSQKMASD